eukprot:2602235-Rhodomonas_salina.2
MQWDLTSGPAVMGSLNGNELLKPSMPSFMDPRQAQSANCAHTGSDKPARIPQRKHSLKPGNF